MRVSLVSRSHFRVEVANAYFHLGFRFFLHKAIEGVRETFSRFRVLLTALQSGCIAINELVILVLLDDFHSYDPVVHNFQGTFMLR